MVYPGNPYLADDTPHPRATSEMINAARLIPGTALQIRTRDWHLAWCNQTYADMVRESPATLVGSHLSSVMPQDAAEERMHLLAPVLTDDVRMQYLSLWQGKRCVCTVLPLDADSLGLDGMLGVITPTLLPELGRNLPITQRPVLGAGLESLSRAELGIVYLFARGLTVPEVARRLCRSPQTVHQHFKSIHRKLGLNRQMDVAMFLARSGIAGFSELQWCAMTGCFIPGPAGN
ncbi:MAG: LuxR C-terminal-related transcriptional regulator [Phycisphaerales bacterium]